MIPVLALAALSVPIRKAYACDSKRLSALSQSLTYTQMFAQNGEADENEVSTGEVEKYVSVYKAMQRNRSMTVDQAAAAQGLSTKQFRELENRVQRDDAALQQARDELQAAAQASPAGGGSGANQR